MGSEWHFVASYGVIGCSFEVAWGKVAVGNSTAVSIP